MVGDNLAQRLLEGGEVLGGRAHQREGEVAVEGAQIVNVEKQAPLLRMVRASSARARAAVAGVAVEREEEPRGAG